jgi:hypothetical protein
MDFAYLEQRWRSELPTRLPDKPRAKSIHANQRTGIDSRNDATPRVAAKPDALANVDWLALWALSLAVSAMFIAALVYFGEDDATGAAVVLAGTACIIAIALLVTEAPVDRS